MQKGQGLWPLYPAAESDGDRRGEPVAPVRRAVQARDVLQSAEYLILDKTDSLRYNIRVYGDEAEK